MGDTTMITQPTCRLNLNVEQITPFLYAGTIKCDTPGMPPFLWAVFVRVNIGIDEEEAHLELDSEILAYRDSLEAARAVREDFDFRDPQTVRLLDCDGSQIDGDWLVTYFPCHG